MISIGNTLKDARNKKTLSFDEIHAKIKIHPRVLQLLEEEKFGELPSPLFVKSFLRSYAEFLEVSPEEVIQAYERTGAKSPEQTLYIKPAETKNETFDVQKIFTVVPFIALGIFVVAGGFYYFSKPKPSAPVKRSGVVHPQRVTAETSAPAPKKTSAAAKIAEPHKEAPAAKPDDRLRSPEAGNFPSIDKKTGLEFELKALDAVWIAVTVDGKVLYQGILKKGSVEKWSANDSIEIWTGNAANMLLSVNKTSIGSPGKGMIRRLQISRDGVRILPNKEVR